MATNYTTQPRLVIIEGKDKGKVLTLSSGTTVIGRTKGDVILADSRVSRSHVELHYDSRSGKLRFTDLKSLNGTLLNGETAEAGVLVDGDRLQVGNTLFDCQLTEPTEVSSVPEAPGTPLAELDESSSASVDLGHIPLEPQLDALQSLDDFEDTNSGASPPPKKPRKKAKPASPQRSFARFSPLHRNLMLFVLVLGGASLLLGPAKEGPSGSNADLDREVTSVRKLEKEGRLEEAIEKAESLAESYSDAELLVTLGALYAQQRRLEPAIQAFRRALGLQPDHPVANVRLIGLYLHAGMGKEAQNQLDKLDQMMKDGKHSRDLFVEAANLFLEFRELTRSPEKAMILSKALQNEIALDSTIGFKLEAQLMFQQNQLEDALGAIERGLKRDPTDEWLLENLAFARLSLKDSEGAIETVENWIRLHPDTTKALLVMGYLRFNEKNYLAALPHLQKIVQVAKKRPGDPHLPEALHLMGQVYIQQGQASEARGLFAQACDLGFTQSCSPPETAQDGPGEEIPGTVQEAAPPSSADAP